MKADWRISCNIKSPVKTHPASSPPNGRTMHNDWLVGALVDEESTPEYLFEEFDERRLAPVELFFATYNRLGGKDFSVLGWGEVAEAGQIVRKGKIKPSQKRMTAGLKSNEDISQGVRRIAKKQASVITKHLKRKRIHRELGAVHHARKHIKKLRALLRLVREGLGRKLYHREKAGLRKLNRALSPVREATVHLKTLGSLRRGYPDGSSENDFDSLKQSLLRNRTRQMQALKTSRVLGNKRIRRIKSKMGDWELKKINPQGLWSGIEQARQRFMDAHQRARLEPNDENIHEWRKRAKDLLYQSEFLKNMKPDFFSRRISRLKKLGDYLGAVHDLARLESDVRKLGVSDKWSKSSGARRLQLQKLAFALADQNELFADKFQS